MKNKLTLFLTVLFVIVNSITVFAEDVTFNSYYEVAQQNCHGISDIRFEMDRINNEILQLLTERTAYVKRAGDLKSKATKIADDRQRVADQEQKIIKKSMELGLPLEISLPAFRNIMEESIKFQQRYIDQLTNVPALQITNAPEKEGKVMDYEKLKIKSFKHWDLYLHENQCYLGRTFVQLKDESGIEDFLDIKGEVREEFFQIGQSLKKALKTLFKPDKMNYAALSNASPVIHMHIIPRYKEPREFNGVIFKDTRWGQNYAPYDRSFITSESILFKIRDALKEQL